MAREFKVFISHSWAHSDDLEALQELLEERGYFHVEFLEATKNTPINSENASYVKVVLKQKILNADIVLALAGIYATHSDWMIWEMETAQKNSIPIVGIIPKNQQRISQEVYQRSIVDIEWDVEKIVAAIRAYAKAETA